MTWQNLHEDILEEFAEAQRMVDQEGRVEAAYEESRQHQAERQRRSSAWFYKRNPALQVGFNRRSIHRKRAIAEFDFGAQCPCGGPPDSTGYCSEHCRAVAERAEERRRTVRWHGQTWVGDAESTASDAGSSSSKGST